MHCQHGQVIGRVMYNPMYGVVRMIRKQVYLEARQDRLLKALAKRTGVSEAELIRRSVDRTYGGKADIRPASPGSAWEQLLADLRDWVSHGVHRPTKSWTRDELYEARLDGRGRTRSH